jgi:hypothetical protein
MGRPKSERLSFRLGFDWFHPSYDGNQPLHAQLAHFHRRWPQLLTGSFQARQSNVALLKLAPFSEEAREALSQIER